MKKYFCNGKNDFCNDNNACLNCKSCDNSGGEYREIEIEEIKIKYLKDIQHIEKVAVGDWIDLRCAEDTYIEQGEYKMIPLGVAMELPKGYEAIVAPRSSTFKKYGVLLANSFGIIDETYKGDNDEWKFLALCIETKQVIFGKRCSLIRKGERICQFRIVKHQPEVELVEVEHLGNSDRGGIGSTGTI